MSIVLKIALYSSLVFVFLTIVGASFAFLGKFFTDISEDPDAAH